MPYISYCYAWLITDLLGFQAEIYFLKFMPGQLLTCSAFELKYISSSSIQKRGCRPLFAFGQHPSQHDQKHTQEYLPFASYEKQENLNIDSKVPFWTTSFLNCQVFIHLMSKVPRITWCFRVAKLFVCIGDCGITPLEGGMPIRPQRIVWWEQNKLKGAKGTVT